MKKFLTKTSELPPDEIYYMRKYKMRDALKETQIMKDLDGHALAI